jgi:hypothetical protein
MNPGLVRLLTEKSRPYGAANSARIRLKLIGKIYVVVYARIYFLVLAYNRLTESLHHQEQDRDDDHCEVCITE